MVRVGVVYVGGPRTSGGWHQPENVPVWYKSVMTIPFIGSHDGLREAERIAHEGGFSYY